MSSKNKDIKQGRTANHPKLHVLDHDPTPQELIGVIVQLRETVDAVRITVLRQLNEALELCEAAINPTVIKPVKPAVKPVVRPIIPTVLPKKPAAKKPAKRPAGKPAMLDAPKQVKAIAAEYAASKTKKETK